MSTYGVCHLRVSHMWCDHLRVYSLAGVTACRRRACCAPLSTKCCPSTPRFVGDISSGPHHASSLIPHYSEFDCPIFPVGCDMAIPHVWSALAARSSGLVTVFEMGFNKVLRSGRVLERKVLTVLRTEKSCTCAFVQTNAEENRRNTKRIAPNHLVARRGDTS